MKKTVVFDFDGVIHSYKSGWKGATVIPDEPVEGIEEVLSDLKEKNYEIAVVSSRCATKEGKLAILAWLEDHYLDYYVDKICTEKPPAIVYVDDRAIRFDGKTEGLVDKITSFKSWTQK